MYNILKSTVATSSIHGISQIFLCKTWPGRLFWFLILLCASYEFYVMLTENIHYFVNQPVTRSIDTIAYPISLVPFPAVTICSSNCVYKSKSDVIEKKLIDEGIKPDTAHLFFKKLFLLRGPLPINDTDIFKEIIDVLPLIGYNSTHELMEEVAQPCETLLQHCAWDGVAMNCAELFTQSVAEMGFCCSFNSELYPVKSQNNYFTTAGPLHGLYVRFNMSESQHVSKAFPTNFMVVYVHGRHSYAEEFSYITFFTAGKEINMRILPDVFDAERLLRQVNVEARQCFMDGEGFNFLNQSYTVANCMIMCKRDTVASFCGCVPHYYPQSDKWKSCTLLDVPCLARFQSNYTNLKMKLNSRGHSQTNKIECDCLPSCSGYTYSGPIEPLVSPKKNANILQQASIRIYFQNHWCKKYIITRSLSGDSFIGLVGGLFALCLGGSILSIIEIIYKLIKFAVLYTIQKTYKPVLYWNELQPVKEKYKNYR